MNIDKHQYLFDIKTISNEEGALSILNFDQNFCFPVKRLFYEYGMPISSIRGKHANKNSKFCFICMSGSCVVTVNDGISQKEYLLNTPNKGLFIDKMLWKEMSSFSPNCVLAVLSDHFYDPDEYIRDFDVFTKSVGH